MLYDGAAPGALAAALGALADAGPPAPAGRRGTGSRRAHFSWVAHCRAAGRGHRGDARDDAGTRGMTRPHPATSCSSPTPSRPSRGGSGWSTYELARGLRAHGDRVTIAAAAARHAGRPPRRRRRLRRLRRPRTGRTVARRCPFVRNYVKNERLARRLAPVVRDLVRERAIDVVHGQHLLSIPGAIAGAHAAGVPVVATIRDYWPVCYWSDLIHDDRARRCARRARRE